MLEGIALPLFLVPEFQPMRFSGVCSMDDLGLVMDGGVWPCDRLTTFYTLWPQSHGPWVSVTQ